MVWITEVAAWAWIHGCGKHEAGGIGQRHRSSRNRDRSIFHGLPHDLKNILAEFWQLIEEENAVVSKAHLTWAGLGATADEPCI